MEPQNPQPNFDFIMNPQKHKGMGDSSAAKKKRILVVLGGALGLLVVSIVGWSLISSASGKTSNQILDLAAYQSELKRIITLGTTKARTATTKNKALTASYTLESDYQQTVGIIQARGITVPKDLTSKYASTTLDNQLDAAEKANEFDAKYEEIYKEKLTNYKAKLAEIYPSLNPSEQLIIKKSSDNAKILLGEPLTTPKN